MAETPNPTTEAVLEALPLVDGRVSAAMREIVRRLRENLPAAIDALNEQLGHGAGKGIPQVDPKDIRVAPLPVDDAPANCVLVTASVQTEAQAPRTFKNEVQIGIFSIQPRADASEQLEDAWDRAGLIRGILYHFLTGCQDAQGRICWRLLEPQMQSFLPESLGNRSGAANYYRLVQPPSDNNWI